MFDLFDGIDFFDCLEKFYSTCVYSEDEVLASYIKATCEDLRTLSDNDVLYVFEKISRLIIDFLYLAECDVKAKISRIVNCEEVRTAIIKFGKNYYRNSDETGKVKLYGMWC